MKITTIILGLALCLGFFHFSHAQEIRVETEDKNVLQSLETINKLAGEFPLESDRIDIEAIGSVRLLTNLDNLYIYSLCIDGLAYVATYKNNNFDIELTGRTCVNTKKE